ncbi:Rossmann fold nucleotide-binding protein Smf possibly involved in DNA uptake [Alkalibacterium sp. AK22]|uniref:DNA-processing protein DprA n=1 Tax=Alkalibacterium sp. AK22 TaxID=1229520 RepID=UPI000449684F|nr:DNA-processing protein DprA [Alkalibacterium sp. AK22]EXJ22597.1 Rossmann fold nucleotide-binding protein Smf possibly involved in DNA uptake [Alkalibacterium sp. AK22]
MIHTAEYRDRLLIDLAHFSGLSIRQRWQLAYESIPELRVFQKDGTEAFVSAQKRNTFLRFQSSRSIMPFNKLITSEDQQILTILSASYPEALRQSFEPPLVLFYKGDISLVHMPLIAVVGARFHTPYAFAALKHLLSPLIENGVGVVSGLARGVDALAHQLVIERGGKTVGVIGTGLDQYYPSSSRSLQISMQSSQLVLSEYPLATRPQRHHFPQRNRIIAGLARGTLVIEAKNKSGSLITARMALDEGRDVFAVPGSIFSPLSKGCNTLIQAGAIPCTSGEDILAQWKDID